MTEITQRQTRILKVIIEEYVNSAEPVGSENLEKKYDIGVSPATIRNEMIKLTEAGYLKQPHTSAGRIPTKEAFRFYVNQLMQEKRLSVAEEVAARERVWDTRNNFDQLMHETTRALAQQAKSLAVATSDNGNLYHAGYSNILTMPEFFDIDVTRTLLGLLDESRRLLDALNQANDQNDINLLFGDEMGFQCLEPCGMVFIKYHTGHNQGSLGVIGANRFHYSEIIPLVRYYANLIEELSASE